jgi:hypothetical protein
MYLSLDAKASSTRTDVPKVIVPVTSTTAKKIEVFFEVS